jgi:hypothetical protein
MAQKLETINFIIYTEFPAKKKKDQHPNRKMGKG